MSLVLVWLMKLRWCCGEGFEEGKYWLWLKRKKGEEEEKKLE